MKSLLFIFLCLPGFVCAQSHRRYVITIPGTVPGPFVAEMIVPPNGKVVSLSPGGNHDRARSRVSWGARNGSTPTIWFEMVFPSNVTPSAPENLTVTTANGATISLAPISSLVPNSALALFAAPEAPLNLSADQDLDGLSFLLEHMLQLSDHQKNDAMKAFTVTNGAGGRTLGAPLQLVEGYDLVIRPALGTGPLLPSVLLASQYQSVDGTRLEIPNVPKTFLFTVSVLPPAE